MPTKILIASEARISIRSMRDIAEAVGAAFGSAGLILTESDLAPEFFDLRSGVAGELFQKFTNYELRLALVVARLEDYGDRFQELAREHRSHPSIRILTSRAEAEDWLRHKC